MFWCEICRNGKSRVKNTSTFGGIQYVESCHAIELTVKIEMTRRKPMKQAYDTIHTNIEENMFHGH